MVEPISEYSDEEVREHMATDHAVLGYGFGATAEGVLRDFHDRDHRRFQKRLEHSHEGDDDDQPAAHRDGQG